MVRTRRDVVASMILAVGVIVLAGARCGGESNPASSGNDIIAAADVPVTAEAWGDDWPFTVPSGTLLCRVFSMDATVAIGFAPIFGEEVVAFFRTEDGRLYWLGGGDLWVEAQIALRAEPNIEAIWRDHPRVPGAKISYLPLLDQARRLCG